MLLRELGFLLLALLILHDYIIYRYQRILRKMYMNRYSKSILAMVTLASSIFLVGVIQAEAGSVFSFFLPIQNLNINPPNQNNRSNLVFNQQYTSSLPADYQIGGDSFILGATGQSYHISKVRLWISYGQESSATSRDLTILPSDVLGAANLYAGPDNGQPINGQVNNQIISVQPQTVAATRVWYANGQNYQRPQDQAWRALWQLDFAVNWIIQGGKLYHYFLDGLYVNSNGLYQTMSLHGANAALSGVPTRNTDATFLRFDKGTATITVLPVPFNYNVYEFDNPSTSISRSTRMQSLLPMSCCWSSQGKAYGRA